MYQSKLSNPLQVQEVTSQTGSGLRSEACVWLGVEKGRGRLDRELQSLHQRPPARWRGTAEARGEAERTFRSLHGSRPPAVLGTLLYGWWAPWMLTGSSKERSSPVAHVCACDAPLRAASGKRDRAFAESGVAVTLCFTAVELEDLLHGGHFMPPHVELGILPSPEAPDGWCRVGHHPRSC